MPPDGPSRFKSRFSLLSLLPSRHPTLITSHSPPLPLTQTITRHIPRIHESASSPVQSEYPSTPSDEWPSSQPTGGPVALPLSAGEGSPPFLPPVMDYFERRHGKTESPRRPAPINMRKIRETYPSKKANIVLSVEEGSSAVRDEPGRVGKEGPNGKETGLAIVTKNPTLESYTIVKVTKEADVAGVQGKDVKQAQEKDKELSLPKRKPKPVLDDPFDIALVEPGHRYTSWRGGKVDIKPGQVIPPGILHSRSTPTIRGVERKSDFLDEGDGGDMYESVLHNVLLTPTYLRISPNPQPTPSPTSPSSSSSRRPRTFIDRAARGLSVALAPRGIRGYRGRDVEVGRSLKGLRERETAEMDKFRRGLTGKTLGLADDRGAGGRGEGAYSTGLTPVPGRRAGVYKRSPIGDQREWTGTWDRDVKNQMGEREKAWKKREKDGEKAKRRAKLWKYAIAILVLIICALVIGLCSSLLTRSSRRAPTSSSGDTSGSTSPSSSAALSSTASSASPSPTMQSASLSSCLSNFASLSSPALYPCSSCVPLLRQTANDYLQPLVGGNGTNVGAALQLCAILDLLDGTGNKTGLQSGSWGQGVNVCSWGGLGCDSRGRIISLTMTYPDVPNQLPGSLGDLVVLQTLKITGNSTTPAGDFPSQLLNLTSASLTTLDIEHTALSGALANIAFSAAMNLTTLTLVNNMALGTGSPDLSKNSRLATLVITGQGVNSVVEGDLPSNLTYLDLSYNSISGTVPSFAALTSLQTLYLTNNELTSSPSSLPSSLTSLELTSNPSLKGNMPLTICTSPIMSTCDLRDTQLSGANITSTTIAVSFSTAAGNPNGTATSSAGVANPSGVPRVCGICQFV